LQQGGSRAADEGGVAASERIVNTTRGTVVGVQVRRAAGPWTRFVGLLGRAGLDEGAGLHIVPCSSVHMFFMRFALDIIYLDAGLRVVKTVEHLRPWRLSAGRGGHSTLELPVGTVQQTGTRAGDQLEAMPAEK
jgi:uncharacterized membrane protein (UPF0127 family)